MPGYNHRPDCQCGWCVKESGYRSDSYINTSSYVNRDSFRSFTEYRLTNDTITNPNATCPICGARVFFYQNAYGSEVYFDDLGPPWQKHPCTDNSDIEERSSNNVVSYLSLPIIEKSDKWVALQYLKTKIEDSWVVLYLRTIETNEFCRILVTDSEPIPKNLPVYMLAWDDNYCTDLEFLDFSFSPIRIWGWKYDKWFLEYPTSCLIQRYNQNRKTK